MPALGPLKRVGRRSALGRLGLVVGLLTLALVVRATGLVSPAPDTSPMPGLPGAAEVVPGLIRGGQPTELDLIGMHNNFGVRWVVNVEGSDQLEDAVTRELGVNLLQLDVSDGMPNSAQLLDLVAFLRTTPAARPAVTREVVYIHDRTGCGPVLVVSGVLQLMRGAPLEAVLSGYTSHERSCITDAQIGTLNEVAAVVKGSGTAVGSFADLRGVTW
jgi:hypothetical protein